MRKTLLLLLLTSLILLCSCNEKPLTIVHASDLHYLSPTLVESRAFIEDLAQKSDGKDFPDVGLITDAFISQMLKEKPAAVVLSGDLTFNGEEVSHRELHDKLLKLKDNGIKVFVIPGNHDVYQTAYRFTADGSVIIEGTQPQTFEDIWGDFGYNDALYADPMSLSYVAELDEFTWLLAVDTNTGSTGLVRTVTLSWLEPILKKAQEEGIRVISTTHQNLFIHNPSFDWGYRISNNTKLISLFEKYSVHLNLSGHLHIQHTVSEGEITDIAVSSLCVTPLQYGVLRIKDNSYTYDTKEIRDSYLQERAMFFFDQSTANKGGRNATSETVLSLIKQINREYFRGAYSKFDEKALEELRSDEKAFSNYINKISQDNQTDHRHAKGTL